MSGNIIARTHIEWLSLAHQGDKDAITYVNRSNAAVERHRVRFPIAYSQDDMQEEHKYWYQKLADFLNKPIYATGSVLRGYWRSKDEEDAISKKFNVPAKYSDFDVDSDNITREELEKANKELKPIADFSLAKWERKVLFIPNKKQ